LGFFFYKKGKKITNKHEQAFGRVADGRLVVKRASPCMSVLRRAWSIAICTVFVRVLKWLPYRELCIGLDLSNLTGSATGI
jgi:hypothetical protein